MPPINDEICNNVDDNCDGTTDEDLVQDCTTVCGPGTATYTLSLYAWQQTFSFIKWGYGATLSLFALFIILVLANVFVRVFKVRW